jgi:hypothetical protein
VDDATFELPEPFRAELRRRAVAAARARAEQLMEAEDDICELDEVVDEITVFAADGLRALTELDLSPFQPHQLERALDELGDLLELLLVGALRVRRALGPPSAA